MRISTIELSVCLTLLHPRTQHDRNNGSTSHSFASGRSEHKPRVNKLSPRSNGQYFADDIFICIFANERSSLCIHIQRNLPQSAEMSTLVQAKAWRRTGDMVQCCPRSTTPLGSCRPQWVNTYDYCFRTILSWYLEHTMVTSQWARWRLKSPVSPLFTQPFAQAQINENIKAPCHWPFVRGIHRWSVNSPHKGPVTRKKLPFDDVIMNLHMQNYLNFEYAFIHAIEILSCHTSICIKIYFLTRFH